MSERQTPETKWYVTEYPDECSFAITDGNEILATIIGGNTIGDQCDLASRIAKLPDLESECEEAIDKYQSLQKTFEEWQLKFLSEQAELLHNKDVQHDKLFDEAYQIRIERDEAIADRDILRIDSQREAEHHDRMVGELEKVYQERDEARELCRELADLVAYGLGQSGEPWSLDAMRQATDAIQKAKQMGTLPTD